MNEANAVQTQTKDDAAERRQRDETRRVRAPRSEQPTAPCQRAPPIPLGLSAVWREARPDVQRRRRSDHSEWAERHPELTVVDRDRSLDL
jgi:hypothetical protein